MLLRQAGFVYLFRMKKPAILLSILLFFFTAFVNAQNVGINTNSPATTLDVNGGFAVRPDAVKITLSSLVTTVNVANKSYVKLTSDNDTASKRLINLTPGVAGQTLVIEFDGVGAAMLLQGTTLSNNGKILINGSFVFNDRSLIYLISDGTDWKEVSRSSYSNASTTYQVNPGDSITVVIPPGVTKIRVTLWGAGGDNGTFAGSRGGHGGFVRGEINVSGGEQIKAYAGLTAISTPAGIAEMSFIKRGTQYLAIAGAGGTAGGYLNDRGNGGDAGAVGLAGVVISNPRGGSAGGGGSQVAGGAGGNAGAGGVAGNSGTSLNGADNIVFLSGTGGQGYFGGGASGVFLFFPPDSYATCGGGGGGSNFIGGLTGSIINSNAVNPSSLSNPFNVPLPTSHGIGYGYASQFEGGNGYVVIEFL